MADPADGFGGLPVILQWALGIGTVLGSTIAIIVGVRSKAPPADLPPATAGPAVQWFLDGPVGKAIALLEGIYREAQHSREDQQRQANENNAKLDQQTELMRKGNELLSQIKDRVGPYQINGPRRRP